MLNVCYQVEEFVNGECIHDILYVSEEIAFVDYHTRLNRGLQDYEWIDHGEEDTIISLHVGKNEGDFIRLMQREIRYRA